MEILGIRDESVKYNIVDPLCLHIFFFVFGLSFAYNKGYRELQYNFDVPLLDGKSNTRNSASRFIDVSQNILYVVLPHPILEPLFNDIM